MRRRRLLTGLSAASVAAALPSFAASSRAVAQDTPAQIIARLERGAASSLGREYRLFLKSSRIQTLPQTLRVREAYVLYQNGVRQTLNVSVASAHEFTRFERSRRAPPRLPPLTLDPENERLVATLSLRTPSTRDERGRTQIVMSLADQRFTLPEVTLMA